MTDNIVSAAPVIEPRGRRLLKLWGRTPLWRKIFGALVAGAIVGYFWGENAVSIKWIGDAFVRLIRMVVVPLVFMIIASGVAGLGDTRRLGTIGVKTVVMYILSMLIAVTIGISLALLVGPGVGVSLHGVAPQAVMPSAPAGQLFLNIIPVNPIKAMADGDMLAIIFFGLMVGSAIVVAGKEGEPAARLLQSGSEVMLRIVGFVMAVAPLGVFALIAVMMGTSGPSALLSILRLALCVVAGAFIQLILVHGAIVAALARLRPGPFFRGIADAMMVGFSTTSSSATLPVAIRVAEENLGIKQPISSTVLPLGVSIGLDGTALYVAALSIFAAQAYGVPLGIGDYALIALVTTFAVMGAAPVPSGALFVLAAVLGTVGIGAERAGVIVAFMLPFDRLLDMVRTVPNVTVDLAVATALARWEGEIDLEVYNSSRIVA